jgi:hypothetical protein
MESQNGTTGTLPSQTASNQAPSPAVTETPATEGAKKPSNSKAARTQRALAKIAEAHVAKSVEAPKDAAPEAAKEPTPAPVVEAKKEEVPPVQSKNSKRVLELQARESSIAKRESQLQAKEAEISARESKLSKDNPLGVLEALGITFSDLADAVIADSKVPDSVKKEMKRQREEMDGVKKKLEAEEKAKKDLEIKQQDEYYKTTVETFKGNLRGFLEKERDTYELIDLNGAQDLVFDTMVQYYEEYGELPDKKVAAEQVEKFLEDRYRQMEKAKKFKPAPPPPPAPEEEKKSKTKLTLTNSMTSGAPSKADSSVHMSRAERLAKAASKIRWDS